MIEKFKAKWFNYQEFLNYFHNEWVQQNSLWYEGATFNLSIPSHNNALEAKNLVMKRDHTLRSRLPLDQYFTNATTMLKNWSIDGTKHKVFISDVEITNELYEIAYNLINHIKCSVVKMDSAVDMYLICKEKHKH
jgi:hypothetical protein